MADIKPCPFCGSTEIEYKPTYTGGGESHGVMVCHQCGCTVPTSEFGRRVKEPYSEWNRRYGECDRKALLEIADNMERNANSTPQEDGLSLSWLLDEFADQIREAIGDDAS